MGDSQIALDLGLDPRIQTIVNRIKELETLKNSGKVKPEIYEQLVSDARSQIKKINEEKNPAPMPHTAPPNRVLNKKRTVNMVNRVRNNFATGRSRGPSSNSRFSSFSSTGPGGSFTEHPSSVGTGKVWISDYLLRLGRNRFGKGKWKRQYVMLYDNGLVLYTKKADIDRQKKPSAVISLSADSAVSEPQGGVVKKRTKTNETGSDVDGLDALLSENDDIMSQNSFASVLDDRYGREHVFIITTGVQKLYLSAEDEVKKEYWVSMLSALLMDLKNKKGVPAEAAPSAPTGNNFAQQLFEEKNRTRDQFLDNQRKRFNTTTEEERKKEEVKAERYAIQSVSLKWKIKQREEALANQREQDRLRKELDALEEKFHSKERENEQLKQQLEDQEDKYRKLLEEARERNQERENKKKDIKKELNKLRRMSVNPNGRGDRDFENEIEMLKTKLKALESALNVDISNLDWDGTLEDAENKMRLLVPDLMSEDEKVQREAQAMFDQWDNIIRNHAEFKEREIQKWTTWEEDNHKPNLDALAEMKTMVPLTYKNEADIMAQTGASAKVAARIKKNEIFKMFYMQKESIAKIHEADLLNKYASQGLDIREMRAVYASLPEEFQNDAKGVKRNWRDQLRNRLADLTKKETANSLSAAEKLNNAYRTNAVSENQPKNFKKAVRRPKKNANSAMAQRAAALRAKLEGKVDGGPKPPSAKKAPAAAGGLDPNDAKYVKYFKMQKIGLRDPQIEAKMVEDGLDGSLWPKLVAAKKSGGATSAAKPAMASIIPESEKKLDANDAKYATYFKMQSSGLPEGAIMNRMQKDGLDPSLWADLVELKEKQASNEEQKSNMQNLIRPKNEVFNRDPKPRSLSTTSRTSNQAPLGRSMTNKSEFDEIKNAVVKQKNDAVTAPEGRTDSLKLKPKPVRKKKKKSRRSKNKSMMSNMSEITDVTGVETVSGVPARRKSKKNTRRGHKSKTGTMRASKAILSSDPNALLDKIKLGAELDKLTNVRGSHGITLEYAADRVREEYESEHGGESDVKPEAMGNSNKASRRPSRRKKKKLQKKKLTLEEVIAAIMLVGNEDKVEGGIKTVTFGELANHFTDKVQFLNAILMRGKRSGHFKYKGDTMYLGIHDAINVTVMKQAEA